jgi:hypothetical protein
MPGYDEIEEYDLLADELAELSAREFEAHVDRLAAAHEQGRVIVTSPICHELSIAVEDVAKLKRLVAVALRARAWFRRYGPTGAPLFAVECG